MFQWDEGSKNWLQTRRGKSGVAPATFCWKTPVGSSLRQGEAVGQADELAAELELDG